MMRTEFYSAFRAWRIVLRAAMAHQIVPLEALDILRSNGAAKAACNAAVPRSERYNGVQSWPAATRRIAINNALRCAQVRKFGYARTPVREG